MTGKPTILFAASASADAEDQVRWVLVCSSEVTPWAGTSPFLAGEPPRDRWRSRRAPVRTGFGP